MSRVIKEREHLEDETETQRESREPMWSDSGVLRDSLLLVSASFIVLFQELALIRWIPSQVRVIAYFPNVVLISSFLGLGVGCLLASRRSVLWTWPVAVLLLAGVSTFASDLAFTQESVQEHLWLLYADLPSDATVVQGIRLPILVGFILTAISFVGLGQLVAQLLRRFGSREKPLIGYVFDLAGSIVGIAIFTLFSFLRTEPAVWFIGIGVLGLILLPRKALILHIVCWSATVFVVVSHERGDFYSPYYALSLTQSSVPGGFRVLTNGSLHQYAFPVEKKDAFAAGQVLFRDGYHLPYSLLDSKPRKVLILGAGTGNDVAVALDQGVEQVDVVEIDPVILEIGMELHPNKPYESDRVNIYNTDARVFLSQTDEKYDLIIYGTLDSMTKLSALSSVRLDNFVYTVEGLESARARLADNGAVILYFWVGTPFIDDRLGGMLGEVFEEPPIVIREFFMMFNRVFLAGSGVNRDAAVQRGAVYGEGEARLATDDWPYLYLRKRGITSFYLSVIGAILLITVLSVGGALLPHWNRVKGMKVDLVMFLYGVAFLLLETKAITEMNLVWGTTWLTNAVVFGSIITMILLSTLMMHFRPLSLRISIVGLALSLVLNWLAPYQAVAGASVGLRLAFSMLFVGLPIFFAATSFAVIFSSREELDVAFGWNLLGAVVGGVLEFMSMATGFRVLALVALLMYLTAYAIFRRSTRIEVTAG